MPFVALKESTNERIYIGDYDDPKQALAVTAIVCADCHEPMGVKAGAQVVAHFFHLPGKKQPCYWRDNSESPAHLMAKRAMAAYLMADPKPFGDCVIEIEYPITTPGGKKRYIDVYIETGDGERYAHEIQLSPQSIDAFEARTRDYRSVDIEPVWWLGGYTSTGENRKWCESNCRYYGEISIGTFARAIDTAKFNSRGEIVERHETLTR